MQTQTIPASVLATEDVASVSEIIDALEAQIAQLGPASKVVHLWRDWMDLLGPSASGETDRAIDLALNLVTPPQ
jgi:hypothetical protein